VRTPPLPRPPARPARLLALLALAGLTAAGAAACSSSHSTASASATSSASALSQDCTDVSDVLADGPDPTADSVGYAEAQILPLKQVSYRDGAVRGAADRLDSAFGAFAAAQGSAQVKAAVQVTSAEDALNALCPGAAP
jgi:hypothetical protein